MAVDILKPEWSTPTKVLVAGLIALAPGTIRELSGDKFSWRDMGNNAIGAFSGPAMIATFTIRW